MSNTPDPGNGPATLPAADGGGQRELERLGLSPEQGRRLAALRERVRRGEYRADQPGSLTVDVALDRRLAFARWLVQRGRLSEST